MESIARKQFSRYIEKFEFDHLFNQLGWDYVDQSFPKKAADATFQFHYIADKAGFAILICNPDAEGKIPDSQTRKRIHTEIAKLYHEHLIIFIDKNKTTQQWELLVREPNKPTRTVSHKWIQGQAPELLYQKLSGAFFSIEEDEAGSLTIIDVVQRVKENFGANAEKVTKAFYAEFKRQHSDFLDFIQGIEDNIPDKDNTNKQWYASLMLNRLMFCYFIQKKGFLDQDKNYLQNKLVACKALNGSGTFYGFYRTFLLELFHDGLGKPINKRSENLPVELGNIPYLNGGLFDVHELEHQFEQITIDDDAFERIFTFFDKWEWHLDTREHAEGKTINPDVIGYIFEKYINDRASMGAYYTKEDITDYIGKNTIIPFLFDETQRNYAAGFKSDSELWKNLSQSGDQYIYEAVKKGVPQESGLFDDLPEDVQAGFQPEFEQKKVAESNSPHLWEMRKTWNQKAPEAISIPTEIYRELIERRKRYADVKSKIERGTITHINDFITYNLNIRQFTQDFIERTEDAAFIRHFYKALRKVTILDPTCGSGAFLFAALNILEPLYQTCIKRMEEFTEEQPGKHKFFEDTLAEIHGDHHPSQQYFIYKSIILNNLYGVDIMNEAVEIAKLRLFLKLVATVEVDPNKNNFGLEPLPDIDFNIRAGNTLVGFATENELLHTIQQTEPLFAHEKLDTFKEEFELVSKAYHHFQNAQLINDQGSDSFKVAKAELNQRLNELNRKLNVYLATNFGIDAEAKPAVFDQWLDAHQPFHWFAEFYRIVAGNGGFDVIIGNPPYIELKAVKKYKTQGFSTTPSGNLYALVLEKTEHIKSSSTKCGFIVPVSSIASERYSSLQQIFKSNQGHYASFDDRPSKLFEGLEHIRLTVHLLNSSQNGFLATKYRKWYSSEREFLFELLQYQSIEESLINDSLPKVSIQQENFILKKLARERTIIGAEAIKQSTNITYYSRKFGNFLQVLNFQPLVLNGAGEKRPPSEFKSISFDSDGQANAATLCLNSTLFFWFATVFSDCRHLNKREVFYFPFSPQRMSRSPLNKKVTSLTKEMMDDLALNSDTRVMKFKHDQLSIQCIIPKYSKPIIDQIDTVLAQHYGFTEEELDFIINYDIKYRMGKALHEDENGNLGKH